MRRRFDLTPLAHPVWWGALALLLINDNLFKGQGVVPGWLAGKLSDFAFLVVAPVLFAAIIPRRVPGRRTAATLAVVGLYVAADLSRGVSDAVVATAARAGLHWKLWPDATDLLALAVLPVTVWLLRRPPRPPTDDPAARRRAVGRERAGVVVGALACLATSSVPPNLHQPFLFNRTTATTEVRITWVLRKVDCSQAPGALAATLTPSDLDDPRAMTLMTGDVAALDGIPAAGASPVGTCSTSTSPYRNYANPSDCIAAILETAGAMPVLMVTPKQWDVPDNGDFISCCDNSASSLTRCAPHLSTGPSPGPEAVSLTTRGGTLQFTLTHTGPHEEGPVGETPIQLEPIDLTAITMRAPTGNGCREARDAYHAAADQASACTSDADCQWVPGLSLPGEMPACVLYVNKTVSSAALQSAEAQWSAMCVSVGDSNGTCWAPLGATCKAGRCAELCAGVDLPWCPSSCSQVPGYPDGICDLSTYGNACLDNDGNRCSCRNAKYDCAPLPLVDPSCPFGCRPYATAAVSFDAGAIADASRSTDGTGSDAAGTDGSAGADAPGPPSDGGLDGARDATGTDDAGQ
jgi:hypothetical protein